MVCIAFRKRLYKSWYLFLDDLAVATGRPPCLAPGPSGAADVVELCRESSTGEVAAACRSRQSGSGACHSPIAHGKGVEAARVPAALVLFQLAGRTLPTAGLRMSHVPVGNRAERAKLRISKRSSVVHDSRCRTIPEKKRTPIALAAVFSVWPTWRAGRPPRGALPPPFLRFSCGCGRCFWRCFCAGWDSWRSSRRRCNVPRCIQGCFSRATGGVPGRGHEPWAGGKAKGIGRAGRKGAVAPPAS